MKKKIYILSVCVSCLLLLVFFKIHFIGSYPFSKLNVDAIEQVTIVYYEAEYSLTAEECAELVELLHPIRIYQRKDYFEYVGLTPDNFFRMKYRDGKVIEFSANNPFFIIDLIGYRTDTRACAVLGYFYCDCVSRRCSMGPGLDSTDWRSLIDALMLTASGRFFYLFYIAPIKGKIINVTANGQVRWIQDE